MCQGHKHCGCCQQQQQYRHPSSSRQWLTLALQIPCGQGVWGGSGPGPLCNRHRGTRITDTTTLMDVTVLLTACHKESGGEGRRHSHNNSAVNQPHTLQLAYTQLWYQPHTPTHNVKAQTDMAPSPWAERAKGAALFHNQSEDSSCAATDEQTHAHQPPLAHATTAEPTP